LRGNPLFRDLDAMVVGKSKVAVPFSDVVRLGDTWTRIKLSDTQGKTLKTRAMSLDSGFVKVDWDGPNPPTSLVVGEVRELQGAYFDVAGKKAVEVPVGRYQIAIGKIDKGKKTQAQQVWIFKGKSKAFEVKAGETTTLEMGGAYRFEFETENDGRKFTIKGDSILLYDRFDALIGKMAPNILLPEVTIKTETGSTLSKGKEMRIVSTEEFNKGHFRAYLPQDFEIDKSPSAKCQARLSLKKDKFLGGPFDSEWQ